MKAFTSGDCLSNSWRCSALQFAGASLLSACAGWVVPSGGWGAVISGRGWVGSSPSASPGSDGSLATKRPILSRGWPPSSTGSSIGDSSSSSGASSTTSSHAASATSLSVLRGASGWVDPFEFCVSFCGSESGIARLPFLEWFPRQIARIDGIDPLHVRIALPPGRNRPVIDRAVVALHAADERRGKVTPTFPRLTWRPFHEPPIPDYPYGHGFASASCWATSMAISTWLAANVIRRVDHV